jgi:hypothetical protein
MSEQTITTAEPTGWVWHCHHEILCEPLTEPIEARIAYIRREKPKEEVALRLRLLKPLRGPLPVALVQARAAYDQARAAYHQAWAASETAWAASETAWAASAQARAAYHQAWAASAQARAASETARAAAAQARAASETELRALHAEECPDCPWTRHPGSIFPDTEEAP